MEAKESVGNESAIDGKKTRWEVKEWKRRSKHNKQWKRDKDDEENKKQWK